MLFLFKSNLLRHRKKDIFDLVDHFITRFASEMGIRKPNLEPSANAFLDNYGWPGNVRELKNVVQRILFTESELITDRSCKKYISCLPKY